VGLTDSAAAPPEAAAEGREVQRQGEEEHRQLREQELPPPEPAAAEGPPGPAATDAVATPPRGPEVGRADGQPAEAEGQPPSVLQLEQQQSPLDQVKAQSPSQAEKGTDSLASPAVWQAPSSQQGRPSPPTEGKWLAQELQGEANAGWPTLEATAGSDAVADDGQEAKAEPHEEPVSPAELRLRQLRERVRQRELDAVAGQAQEEEGAGQPDEATPIKGRASSSFSSVTGSPALATGVAAARSPPPAAEAATTTPVKGPQQRASSASPPPAVEGGGAASSGSSSSPSAATGATAAEEWQVMLRKEEGRKLGLDCDTGDGKALYIEGIGEGLMQDWNTASPEKAVQKGDLIVEINGSQGEASQLIERCTQDAVLHLRVQRPVAGAAGDAAAPPQPSTRPTAEAAGEATEALEAPSDEPVEVYRRAIVPVYEEYNPDKLGSVNGLLAKYKDELPDLYRKICNKYKVVPDPILLPKEEERAVQAGGVKEEPHEALRPAVAKEEPGLGEVAAGTGVAECIQGAGVLTGQDAARNTRLEVAVAAAVAVAPPPPPPPAAQQAPGPVRRRQRSKGPPPPLSAAAPVPASSSAEVAVPEPPAAKVPRTAAAPAAAAPPRPIATPARRGGNLGGRKRTATAGDSGASGSAEKASRDRSSAGPLAARRSRSDLERGLTPRAAGHTLRPTMQGRRVAVIGDGWGGAAGASGGYEAIITEADHKTFTVIAVGGEQVWKETHVLQECCIVLSEVVDPHLQSQEVATPVRQGSKSRRLNLADHSRSHLRA